MKTISCMNIDEDLLYQCFHIEFTRQQITNLTGLRVETVSRTLKNMEKEGTLTLKDRKFYINMDQHDSGHKKTSYSDVSLRYNSKTILIS